MYDMKLKHKFIERALKIFVERSSNEVTTIFHRDKTLHLDDLICHRTTSFFIEIVNVTNDVEVLNRYVSFVVEFCNAKCEREQNYSRKFIQIIFYSTRSTS